MGHGGCRSDHLTRAPAQSYVAPASVGATNSFRETMLMAPTVPGRCVFTCFALVWQPYHHIFVIGVTVRAFIATGARIAKRGLRQGFSQNSESSPDRHYKGAQVWAPEGAMAQTPRPLRTTGSSPDWMVLSRVKTRKRGAVETQRGEQDRASETEGEWLVVVLRDGRALDASPRKGRCDQKSPANNQALEGLDEENREG